jgi:hypothetical protein
MRSRIEGVDFEVLYAALSAAKAARRPWTQYDDAVGVV